MACNDNLYPKQAKISHGSKTQTTPNVYVANGGGGGRDTKILKGHPHLAILPAILLAIRSISTRVFTAGILLAINCQQHTIHI